jgi:hypothetical protein
MSELVDPFSGLPVHRDPQPTIRSGKPAEPDRSYYSTEGREIHLDIPGMRQPVAGAAEEFEKHAPMKG